MLFEVESIPKGGVTLAIKVCVVEDQIDFLEGLMQLLSAEGFEVSGFRTSEDFIWKFKTEAPEILIIDIGLPGEDGISLVKKIRADFPNTVIVVITGRNTPEDVVDALEAGADDFLSKPFSVKELIARSKRVYNLRKHLFGGDDSVLLNSKNREIRTGESTVRLTRTEYIIFETLFENKKNFVRRESLTGKEEAEVSIQGRSLDVHILSLRKKIEPFGLRIETLRGVGYRLTT